MLDVSSSKRIRSGHAVATISSTLTTFVDLCFVSWPTRTGRTEVAAVWFRSGYVSYILLHTLVSYHVLLGYIIPHGADK